MATKLEHSSSEYHLLALPHTHTTPSCLQVEEEDERKKDSERAHEMELLQSCELQLLSFFIDTLGQGENLQGMAL